MAYRRLWPGSRREPSPVSLAVTRSGAAEVAAWDQWDEAPGNRAASTRVTAGLVADAQVVRAVETFDSWPSGALTASTSYGSAGFTTSSGAQSAAASPFGGNALQVTTAAFGGAFRSGDLGARWRASFFAQWSAVPTATHYFAHYKVGGSGGTAHLWLAVTTAGQIQVRNSAFTAPTSGQSLFRVTAGARVRVEVDWDPNVGATVGLFYGPNLYLDTPAEVLSHRIADTPGWAGLGNFDYAFLGNNSSGDGTTLTVDRWALSSGDPLGPGSDVDGSVSLSVSAGLSSDGAVVPGGGGGTTHTATAALAASAGLTASAVPVRIGSVSRSVTAALAASATVVDSASATLSATAGLSADGSVVGGGSSSLSVTAGLSVSATVVDSTTAALAVTAGLSASAVVTDTATAALAASAGLTASGAAVRTGSVSVAATAALAASATVGTPVTATTVTAGLSASASVARAGSASSAGTAGLAASASVTRTGSSALSVSAGLTASGSTLQAATAALAASAALTVTAEGVRTGDAVHSFTAALAASATVVEFVATTPRPDDGATTRPSSGATLRPYGGGTVRPSSGATARPDSGLTLRP